MRDTARKNALYCFSIVAVVGTICCSGSAVAQYVHLSGSEVEKLIVGHAIGMPLGATVFRKDGHLGSLSGQVSKSTYRILPDGQVCFEGGAAVTVQYTRGGGGKIGTCVRIVKSNEHYLAILPDSGRDLFSLNFRD